MQLHQFLYVSIKILEPPIEKKHHLSKRSLVFYEHLLQLKAIKIIAVWREYVAICILWLLLHLNASSAIRSWSVDIQIELKMCVVLMTSKLIWMRLLLPTFCKFFSGIPLEPPRANIKAATCCFSRNGSLCII